MEPDLTEENNENLCSLKKPTLNIFEMYHNDC